MSLRDKATTVNGGNTIIRSESRITSALNQINLVKTELLTLKSQVDASVAAADGVYDAAEQTEVNGVVTTLKAQVQAFAAAL